MQKWEFATLTKTLTGDHPANRRWLVTFQVFGGASDQTKSLSDDDLTNRLVQAGREGWEVVQYRPKDLEEKIFGQYLFKRPLKD